MRPVETPELIITKLTDISNLNMILTRIVALVQINSIQPIFIHPRLNKRLIEISSIDE